MKFLTKFFKQIWGNSIYFTNSKQRSRHCRPPAAQTGLQLPQATANLQLFDGAFASNKKVTNTFK